MSVIRNDQKNISTEELEKLLVTPLCIVEDRYGGVLFWSRIFSI